MNNQTLETWLQKILQKTSDNDYIYIFTPEGDILELQQGATPYSKIYEDVYFLGPIWEISNLIFNPIFTFISNK